MSSDYNEIRPTADRPPHEIASEIFDRHTTIDDAVAEFTTWIAMHPDWEQDHVEDMRRLWAKHVLDETPRGAAKRHERILAAIDREFEKRRYYAGESDR